MNHLHFARNDSAMAVFRLMHRLAFSHQQPVVIHLFQFFKQQRKVDAVPCNPVAQRGARHTQVGRQLGIRLEIQYSLGAFHDVGYIE